MPTCAVVVCKNRSGTVNYRNKGISYHLFPSKPNVKEKWINACGRGPKWFPGDKATICSTHFEEGCFQPLKRRRLFDWAVPSLKLNLVFTRESNICIKMEPENEHVETSSLQKNCPAKLEAETEDTQPKSKLLTLLNQRDNMISKQKKQIRLYRQQACRYKKKVEQLTEILNDMQKNRVVTPDQGEKHRNETQKVTIQNIYSNNY